MQANTFSNGTLAGTHAYRDLLLYMYTRVQANHVHTCIEREGSNHNRLHSVLFRTCTRYKLLYYCVSTSDVGTDNIIIIIQHEWSDHGSKEK